MVELTVGEIANGRLAGQAAVVVGGGQTPGATTGNGRAAAMLYAREGARVLVADANLASAEETAAAIRAEGGEADSIEVDVLVEEQIAGMVTGCVERWGRLDVLHNNVGVSSAGGDAAVTDIAADAYSRILDINLRGMVLAAKHALPVMREQRSGVIINVSSIAAKIVYPTVAYKTSKAGVVALTEHLAVSNADYGIRVNAVLPGLVDTPMAVEKHIQGTVTRDQVVEQRAAKIPLKGHRGDAWDVARAALFLASADAAFITGVSLTVDGGQTLLVG